MISVTIPKKGFKQKTVPTYRIINYRWISQNSWPFLTSFQKSLLSVFLRILLQNNFQEQQSLTSLFFIGIVTVFFGQELESLKKCCYWTEWWQRAFRSWCWTINTKCHTIIFPVFCFSISSSLNHPWIKHSHLCTVTYNINEFFKIIDLEF